MADDVGYTPGTGATVRALDNGSGKLKQVMVLDAGGESAERLITDSNGLPIKGVQPSVDTSFGSLTKHHSKASAGTFYSFFVSSLSTVQVYFQVFNKASDPAGLDVPIYSFPIPLCISGLSPSLLSLDATFFGLSGVALGTGVGWGISSTPATFTDAGTAANYGVHVHYS